MISIFVMTIHPMLMNHTFCTILKTFFNGFNNAPLSTWDMQLNNSWNYIMLIWKTNQRKSSSTMNLLSCFYNLKYCIDFNVYHLLDPMHIHYMKYLYGRTTPNGRDILPCPMMSPQKVLKRTYNLYSCNYWYEFYCFQMWTLLSFNQLYHIKLSI